MTIIKTVKDKSKRKKRIFLILTSAVLIISAGMAVFAYVTNRTQETEHTFYYKASKPIDPSGSETACDIVESFNPDAYSRGVRPGDRIEKSVHLRSYEDFDTYGYILTEIQTVSAKLEAGGQPVVCDCVIPKYNTDKWELIAEQKSTSTEEPSRYLFRCTEVIPANGYTAEISGMKPLFSECTARDFESVNRIEVSLVVTGYVVQTEGMDQDGQTAQHADEAAKAAFYMNQN